MSLRAPLAVILPGRLALIYERVGALPIAQIAAMNPNGKSGVPAPKENSAARLLRPCERARTTNVQSLGNHSSAMDGWAVTFGHATAPPGPPSNARDLEVVRMLGVAQVELDRTARPWTTVTMARHRARIAQDSPNHRVPYLVP